MTAREKIKLFAKTLVSLIVYFGFVGFPLLFNALA